MAKQQFKGWHIDYAHKTKKSNEAQETHSPDTTKQQLE